MKTKLTLIFTDVKFTLLFVVAISLLNHYACCIHIHHHNQNSQIFHKHSHKSHRYYSLQSTRQVSQSKSIQYLNLCKDRCMTMKQIFPFQFKYHRVVYRQQIGDLKYVTGQCLYSFKDQNKQSSQEQNEDHLKNLAHFQQNKDQLIWFSWKNLIQFVQMAPIKNQNYIKQKQTWEDFNSECQNQQLRLSEVSINNFKLSITHSNFQYYDNGGFKNLQSFTDIDDLLKNIS